MDNSAPISLTRNRSTEYSGQSASHLDVKPNNVSQCLRCRTGWRIIFAQSVGLAQEPDAVNHQSEPES
jgi:hypothetical protein